MLCSRHGKRTEDEFGNGSNGRKAESEAETEVEMDGVRGGVEPLKTKSKQESDRNVDEDVLKEDRGCGDECIDNKNDDKANVLVDLKEKNRDLHCNENGKESRPLRQISMSSQKAYDRARQALIAKERDASRWKPKRVHEIEPRVGILLSARWRCVQYCCAYYACLGVQNYQPEEECYQALDHMPRAIV